MTSIAELVLISFFTGLGVGIGNPIGQYTYERWIKKRFVKIANTIDQHTKKGKNIIKKELER